MIHIAIGTKAQFIKTAPLMKCLDRRGIHYRYVDLGQHAQLTAQLRELFQIREPDVFCGKDRTGNVASLGDALRWIIFFARQILNRKKSVFGDSRGICIIHGDTLSTLMGLLAAKRAGLRVFHLEAGLCSGSIFHPIPEEIIRRICMRWSDYLAAPNDSALENLRQMGYEEKSISSVENTGLEAVMLACRQENPKETATGESFALFAIHRFETIMNRRRMEQLVNLALQVSQQHSVRFVVHDSTLRRLRHYHLWDRLKNAGIELLPLMDYSGFILQLQKAKMVVTDGGSIQEECALLGTPCLLFRKKTERVNGLNRNVCLSELDPDKINSFLACFENYRQPLAFPQHHPSDQIADFLISKGFDKP
jgi:UDP-N-acetylglucosamine 2-epimerase (non-hydrolysing)